METAVMEWKQLFWNENICYTIKTTVREWRRLLLNEDNCYLIKTTVVLEWRRLLLMETTAVSLIKDNCLGMETTPTSLIEEWYIIECRRLLWNEENCLFGYSGDALSGLVTREMLGLVWLLGRCFIWFGYSGDALSGLDTRETLGLIWHPRVVSEVAWWQFSKHCLVSITRETLSDLTHSGDAVSRWHHSGDVIRPWPGYHMITEIQFLLVNKTFFSEPYIFK